MDDAPDSLSLEAFIEEIRLGLPQDGVVVESGTLIADLSRDKVSAGSLKAKIHDLLGSPPPDLLRSIETVGEAFGWYQARVSSDDPSPAADAARVRLRPLDEADFPSLYESSTSVERGYRWRYRGSTPGYPEFVAQLFDGVLAQFMVVGADDHPFGMVTAYNAHFENQSVYIGFLRVSNRKGAGEVLEGMLLFIEFLFDRWNFKKLYADVPEFNATGMFDLSSRAVRLEGRLVDHVYLHGRWWDQLIVALWREDWTSEAVRWGALNRPKS